MPTRKERSTQIGDTPWSISKTAEKLFTKQIKGCFLAVGADKLSLVHDLSCSDSPPVKATRRARLCTLDQKVPSPMCLLAILYRLVPESPILVAANREEYYDRPSLPPSIQSGKPRILCGTDQRAGGSWLGVNQNGMFVGMCNRRTEKPIVGTRSRGLLVRELLRCSSARKAVDKALEDLSTNRYEGMNLVIADWETGWVVHSEEDQDVQPLEDGLSIIGARDVNDPHDQRVQMANRLLTLQMLDSPVKFLAVASKVFARSPSPPGRPSMVVRGADFGTVSSTLIALSPKPRDAIFQYAGGSPDKTRYEDYSPMLRDILSRGLRESRIKAKA